MPRPDLRPDPATLEHAKRLSGRVPGVAPLLGITMPPPPGPPRRSLPTRRPAPHTMPVIIEAAPAAGATPPEAVPRAPEHADQATSDSQDA
jgi:hypothetical protein